MYRPVPILVLTFSIFGFALGQEGCGNCFQLNTGTIVGIVICDTVITLVIAGMAFWISNRIQKKKYQEKLNKLKNISPGNESTYEELHGQRVDIYNDLNAMRR
ncbi:TYRO protein tyrosine kinase-binding protein-like [Leptodactylus fuscus]|uniref:TYRO protein tyrosine kinase-binding protein-like n=1 Tax=Leptodactylus fuscus TaxID=238119 RepID=UPI003F4EC058